MIILTSISTMFKNYKKVLKKKELIKESFLLELKKKPMIN